MDQVLSDLAAFDPGLSARVVLLSILASFVLGQLVAATYTWTFRGLSYSRGFAVTLALTGVVATLLMLAIGNSVARGLGLLGALAIIRFRSTLRDVRDMMFIFATLAAGIAVGVQAWLVAAIGTVAFCLFVVHLTFAPSGVRRQYDGLLRFNAPADGDVDHIVKLVLHQHCASFVLVNLREVAQGDRLEHAYQVKLRDPSYHAHLIEALRDVDGVHDVSLLSQDPALEV
jgi:uncharacterized membrane protein YhiD involved in acid resistance